MFKIREDYNFYKLEIDFRIDEVFDEKKLFSFLYSYVDRHTRRLNSFPDAYISPFRTLISRIHILLIYGDIDYERGAKLVDAILKLGDLRLDRIEIIQADRISASGLITLMENITAYELYIKTEGKKQYRLNPTHAEIAKIRLCAKILKYCLCS